MIAKKIHLLSGILWLLWAATALAAVKPHALFSEGMVLQRGIAVPIWGSADTGEKVTVELNGQSVSTVAADGKWMVKLKSLKAGGPYTLKINDLEIKNVLVGDVWICSGQSNMQWSLKQTDNAETEIANAKYPMIRLFTVPRLEVDKPAEDIKANWKECTPDTVPNFSAVGYFFGRDLHRALNVPIGLINNAVGGSPAESWMKEAILKGDSEYQQFHAAYPQAMERYNQAVERHKTAVEKAKAEGAKPPNPPGKPWLPSGLYNGMLAPLAPYAIKGAIWYQGEANATRAYQYRRLFPTMIKNWRADWGQGDFPFLFVQLAAFGPNGPTLGESDWAELREAQTLTLTNTPKTGMALAIDVGTIDDIHPRNKQPVGARLALAARAVAYKQKLVYSGPVYSSMKIEGSRVVLNFNHTGSGLEAKGGELKGFLVAGEDKVWHEAKAEVQGKKVIVLSTAVTKPVAVRYAWAKYPTCNLYNKEGLPAVPFRTDDWPMITAPKK
ncbi:MAG: sialate O-acetylesterase [Blastocatellia bacterium]